LVLVILLVMWAVVLVPPFVRGRRNERLGASIGSFRSELGSLQRGPRTGITSGPVPGVAETWPSRPARMSRAQAAKRRRDILTGLSGATVAFGLAALLSGGTLLVGLALCSLALTAGYIYLLVQIAPPVTTRRAVSASVTRGSVIPMAPAMSTLPATVRVRPMAALPAGSPRGMRALAR
jgi:hypothetical protein